jgi:8-oxo-dGTP pyrophosphatase MutT (NUDIX family)
MQFDTALRDRVQRNLAAFDVRRTTSSTLRAAAVAVPLVEEGEGPFVEGIPQPPSWSSRAALLLTRRSAMLKYHANQWSFPGGRLDPGETAQQAALRELEEEIGLHLDDSHVLGCLDDYVTRSGFVISPIVVWAGAARELVPNPAEVASIHRIPLGEFQRVDSPWLEPSEDAGRQIMRMPVGDTWIAAPTAAIVYQFIEVALHARPTRIDHFDQPLFARS